MQNSSCIGTRSAYNDDMNEKQITIILENNVTATTTINWRKGESPQREIEAIENRINQQILHWWFE